MILSINSGSSSIKFAVYQQGRVLEKIFYGEISRIGFSNVIFTVNNLQTAARQDIPINVNDYSSAIACIVRWIKMQPGLTIAAIGHRIVQGMQHVAPSLITTELLAELKATISYDPDHLPNEIKLIEAFIQHYPKVFQFACFDANFHQKMPRVAKLLPIPRRFDRLGIHRYGFHGLSYSYLMQELARLYGKETADGRIILAHLGSGASLAAVCNGKSIDTSMGFTPSSGLLMSSRSGDLDPGVAWYMMKRENLSPDQFSHLINHESGLLGISETSADMMDLLKQEITDIRSAEAIALFCYQVKKWIGAFTAVLGGMDALVFSGGIGEHSSLIRKRICDGLSALGIELDDNRNDENAACISLGKVAIYVMHTDEEWMIAKTIHALIYTYTKKYDE